MNFFFTFLDEIFLPRTIGWINQIIAFPRDNSRVGGFTLCKVCVSISYFLEIVLFFFFLCDRSSRDLCCVYYDLFQWLNNSIVIVILTSYLEISKARVTKRKTSKSAA